MKCPEWQDLILTDYLDNQMTKEQIFSLEEHLSACQECREFAAHARKAVIEPFQYAQKTEPPEKVWQSIKEAIGQDQDAEGLVSFWGRIREIIFIPKPAMALVTTIIVIMAATFTFNHYNQRFQIAKYAVTQSETDDINYVLDELAAYSEENNLYEQTGIEEYFL